MNIHFHAKKIMLKKKEANFEKNTKNKMKKEEIHWRIFNNIKN